MVVLDPGGKLGLNAFVEIYGTTTTMPVFILACSGPGPLFAQVSINTSYTIAE